MPKVPTYEPQVNPVRMPSVRQSFNLPEPARGVDYSGLARGVNRTLEGVKEIIDQRDEMAAKQAYNAFSMGMQDVLVGQDGVLTKQGGNALDVSNEYQQRSHQLKTQIGEGLDGRAKTKFWEAADRDILSSRDRVMGHQVDQQNKHFDAQDLNGIDQARIRAQADYDAGPAFQYQMDVIKAYASSIAKRKGADVDAYVAEMQEPVHLEVIKKYIDADKPEDAETYLAGAKFANPDKYAAAKDAIDKGKLVKTGNAFGDAVWSQMGSMSPATVPNVMQMYDAIEADATLNEDGKDIAKRRIQEQFQKWRLNKSANEENVSNAVYDQLDRGVDANKIIAGIDASPLDAKSKHSLKDYVKHKRGMSDAGDGKNVAKLEQFANSLDFIERYEQDLRTRGTDAKRNPRDIIALASNFGANTDNVMRTVAQINEGFGKVNVKLTNVKDTVRILAASNEGMRQFLPRVDGQNERDKANMGLLYGEVVGIMAEATKQGRPLELSDAVVQAITKVKTESNWFFEDEYKPLYQIKQPPNKDPRTWTPEQMNDFIIGNYFDRNGVEPSEQEFNRLRAELLK